MQYNIWSSCKVSVYADFSTEKCAISEFSLSCYRSHTIRLIAEVMWQTYCVKCFWCRQILTLSTDVVSTEIEIVHRTCYVVSCACVFNRDHFFNRISFKVYFCKLFTSANSTTPSVVKGFFSLVIWLVATLYTSTTRRGTEWKQPFQFINRLSSHTFQRGNGGENHPRAMTQSKADKSTTMKSPWNPSNAHAPCND